MHSSLFLIEQTINEERSALAPRWLVRQKTRINMESLHPKYGITRGADLSI